MNIEGYIAHKYFQLQDITSQSDKSSEEIELKFIFIFIYKDVRQNSTAFYYFNLIHVALFKLKFCLISSIFFQEKWCPRRSRMRIRGHVTFEFRGSRSELQRGRQQVQFCFSES